METIVLDYKMIRQTDNAVLLELDGDQAWFPKAAITLKPQTGKVEIPVKLFKQKFPNG